MVLTHQQALDALAISEQNLTESNLLDAYRKQAKIYHPNSNSSYVSDEKFLEIRAAYEKLRDYLGGRHLEHTRLKQKRSGRIRVEVGLETVQTGGVVTVHSELGGECLHCSGLGKIKAPSGQVCEVCAGEGTIKAVKGILRVKAVCPACQGTGEAMWIECIDCSGHGIIPGSSNINVEIPAGVVDETILTAPPGTKEWNEAIVAILPHPNFARKGSNLFTSIRIGCVDACLGCEVEIDGLDGKQIPVTIPSGIQPGGKIILSDLGLPDGISRGKLLVRVEVEIPQNLTPKQERYLLAFQQIEEEKFSLDSTNSNE